MSPETALTEVTRGLVMVMTLAGPLLGVVLAVGVSVGVAQAATQINEPTIAFVAKAVALIGAIGVMGNFLMGSLVDFTRELFQRIPHLIG